MCQHQYKPWEWTRDDQCFYLRCVHCKELEAFEVDTERELFELFDMADEDDEDEWQDCEDDEDWDWEDDEWLSKIVTPSSNSDENPERSVATEAK